MATVNENKTVANMSKQFQPELVMVVVASGTTAMLTYYNGYKPKTGTGTDVQLPNRAVGDICFSTVSTTDTIAVTASYDGTNYEAASTLVGIIMDESTGLPITSANLPTGNYRIPYRYHQAFQTFKFTKSGITAVASLSVAKIVSVH